MTNKQHPAQFDWATELLDAQGRVTLSEQEAHEIGARLRRLHSENETLQAGYAAARLEIESLQARIKTMAEEHADELMVAHLDGRMRAAQPAGAQQPAPSVAAHKACKPDMLVNAGALKLALNVLRRAGKHEVADELEKTAQAAPAYKDSTPELHVGDSTFENWYSTYNPAHKADKQRARDAYAAGMGDPLVTAAPQQEADEIRSYAAARAWIASAAHAQADSVLEDAARLEFIERHPEMSLRHHKGRWAFLGFTNYEYDLHQSLREAIDVAMAAQGGK